MARMLAGGEDPLFIARRMVIFASEDIGNADPNALTLAVSAKDAVHFVGLPEAALNLSQAVTYLATAPKSNASYLALSEAQRAAREHGILPVPLSLRNAPTGLMRNLGYGRDYEYPHDDPDAVVPAVPSGRARRDGLLPAHGQGVREDDPGQAEPLAGDPSRKGEETARTPRSLKRDRRGTLMARTPVRPDKQRETLERFERLGMMGFC